jgi:hypothetical protein
MGVLIASLMANSDSFEFIVSSDAMSRFAVLMRRSSMIGVVEFMIYDVDESEAECRFRFSGTNPERRQPARMFFSVNAFGHTLI